MKFLDFNKIIYKYIFTSYIKNCIVYLLALSCIVLLFDYIELFRRYSLVTEDGGSINPIIVLPLLNLPSFLYDLSPFVMFFASFTTYYKLNNSNELCIFRSIGLRAVDFMSPLIFASFFIAMFNFFVIAHVVDQNNLKVEEVEVEVQKQQSVAIKDNMFWAIESYENSYKVAYATVSTHKYNEKSKEIELNKVFLAEYDKASNKMLKSYSSNNGIYNAQSLILYDAYENTQESKEYKTIPIITMDMNQNFKNASLKQRNIDNLSPYNLFVLIFSSGRNDTKIINYFQALVVYIADIFFVINLAITGAILTFGLTRQQNIFLSIGKAITVCFAFYALYSVCLSFGQSGIISILNSTIIPIALITLINSILLIKKENGY